MKALKTLKTAVLFFICVTLLCSCQARSPAVSSAPVQSAPTAGSSEELLVLVGDGATGFGIFVPDSRRAAVTDAARTLASSLGDLTGADMEVAPENKIDPESPLITVTVGRTDTALSEKLYSLLAPDEIGYIVEDGAIALGSVSEEFTSQACGLFLTDFKGFAKRGSFSIPAEALKIAKCSAPLPDKLPVIRGADEVDYFDCSDGYFAASYKYLYPDDFAGYVSALEEAGYEKLYDNSIGNTLAAVFTDGVSEVHVCCLYGSETVRVSVGPAGDPMPREEGTGEGSASLTLLPLKQFGLSMIFTLPDGRFVIVDGGQQSESRSLVKYLAENAPEDEMPVVAAWFFTHAHPDHSYAFFGIREPSLYQQISVENFVFNFPCRKMYERYEPDCIAQTKNVRDTISQCFPDAAIIKPHTGDQMKIGGLTVDFLMTQEDLAPNGFTDFNDSSTVMRFTLAGTTVMVTGDMSNGDFWFVNSNYDPDDLKCDILQVPHHGWNRNQRFFESVDAEIVFIPNNNPSEAPTLFRGMDLEKLTKKALGLYSCAQNTVVIPLPYTADTLPEGYTLG